MLLTCTNCGNSYVVDDQLYLQQGALCEQCHVPMVPAQNYQPQWGQQQPMNSQYNANPQYNNMPPMMDAQWGQQQPQMGMDAQWGQQPNNAFGPQPTMAMDAQWGQQMAAQFGQQPPMDAQFGQQPPMDAQFGQQPPMDAQFGQQPPGSQNQWGTQAQWSQMADKPMETVALMDAIASPVNHGNDAGEKTMAIDADWEAAGLGLGIVPKDNSKKEDWNNGGDTPQKPGGAPPKLPKSPSQKAAGCITVGHQMDPVANENVTRQIDLADVQKMYGDKVNPLKDFLISIPKKYFVISGIVLGLTVILFVVLAIVISTPEKVEKKFNEAGDVLTEDTPEHVMTFSEHILATKELSANFLTFDGEDVFQEGSVAAVTKDGVYYNNKKIAEYDDVNHGTESVNKIIDTLNADVDNIGKPVYVLFEETTPMHVVYRVLYSFYAASRPAAISGTTTTGITAFEFIPCEWPDHGMVSIGDETCKKSTLNLKITTTKLTLRRINSNESLLLDEDTVVTELQDDIVGTRVNTKNTGEAFNRMRIKNRPPIQLAPDGDVSLNVFMRAALAVRGQPNNPNSNKIYLNKVPKY